MKFIVILDKKNKKVVLDCDDCKKLFKKPDCSKCKKVPCG